jgi:Tol biopolymer transport system component
MVYRGVNGEGPPQLWVRRWNALDATPIRDTESGVRPAISPDGQEVAFTVGSTTIRIVPLQGGVPRTLTESAGGSGGLPRWSPDGAWIYYTDASGGLSRLPSGGAGHQRLSERGRLGWGRSSRLRGRAARRECGVLGHRE